MCLCAVVSICDLLVNCCVVVYVFNGLFVCGCVSFFVKRVCVVCLRIVVRCCMCFCVLVAMLVCLFVF